MLIFFATLLCLSSEPANDVDYIHEVDGYIEVNTYFSPESLVKNNAILKQIMVKRWIPQLEGHHVVHWMLIEKDFEPIVTRLPNGKCKVTIVDKGRNRFVIHCNSVIHTITEYDPEIHDREKLKSEDRRFHFRYKQQRDVQRFKPIILLGEPSFN